MTRPLTDRNAEIVSLHDSGSTDAEIAAVYGIAPQRVGQIVRAEIDAPRRPAHAALPGPADHPRPPLVAARRAERRAAGAGRAGHGPGA